MKEFWKNFNIKMASGNIGDEWAEIKQSCMKGVCRKTKPEISDSHDFDPEH